MTGFKTDTLGDWIIKDPDAVLDYTLDWNAAGDSWLSGDTIVTATWTLDAGITKINESMTGTTTTIWLSGGAAGSTYWVSCRIVTANSIPRVEDRSFRVVVMQR
jgi:hypothetical protein